VMSYFEFLLCGPLRIPAASALKWPPTAEPAEIRRGPQRNFFKLRLYLHLTGVDTDQPFSIR
jgi:hypothetical protein